MPRKEIDLTVKEIITILNLKVFLITSNVRKMSNFYRPYVQKISHFQTEIMEAIRTLPYPRSGSNLVATLQMLVTDIFRSANGDRPSVPNVAIVIGASLADRGQNQLESVNVAVRDAGVTLLMIGVAEHETAPQENLDRIRAIGTQIYLVDRFRDMGSVMAEIVAESCPEIGRQFLILKTSYLFNLLSLEKQPKPKPIKGGMHDLEIQSQLLRFIKYICT